MDNYSKNAAQYFKEGYNCAQSVLLAFQDEINLDKETILKLTSSFGGGMGRMREVCGAVSAMFMAAGLIKGYTEPDNDKTKGAHYALIQALAAEFKTCHKTIICRELLGLNKDGELNTDGASAPTPSKRTDEYYAKRPCEDFIRTAAGIIENRVLSEKNHKAEIK